MLLSPPGRGQLVRSFPLCHSLSPGCHFLLRVSFSWELTCQLQTVWRCRVRGVRFDWDIEEMDEERGLLGGWWWWWSSSCLYSSFSRSVSRVIIFGHHWMNCFLLMALMVSPAYYGSPYLVNLLVFLSPGDEPWSCKEHYRCCPCSILTLWAGMRALLHNLNLLQMNCACIHTVSPPPPP